MRLLRLLGARAGGRLVPLMTLTVGGGLLSATVLAIVNEASARDVGIGSWQRGALFLAVLGAMYLSRRWAAKLLIQVFEGTTAQLRADISARLSRAPLRTLETQDGYLSRLNGDLSFISTTLEAWVSGVQHLAFLLSTTLVIAFISARGLVLWCVSLGLMALWLIPRKLELDDALAHLSDESARFGTRVEELHDGLPQLKQDAAMADLILDDIETSIVELHRLQSETEEIALQAFVGAIATLFLVGLGISAFASPEFLGLPPSEGYALVAFFELAWGPIFGVLTSLPQMARAEAAAASVLDVLDDLPEEDIGPPSTIAMGEFETVELSGAYFEYPAQAGASSPRFALGPLDLELRAGELIFIGGSNGGGKTTLVKLLLGLYPLERGQRRLDGQYVPPAELAAWRSMFTVVLNDQPLLERLYGLGPVPQEDFRKLLELFGIAEVVTYENGRFSDLALSAGQRMRLAMVVALLEERPICVFDEWTAHQDPATTRWYYEVMLPKLASHGRTVVAISHDERYFELADRVIMVEEGQLIG